MEHEVNQAQRQRWNDDRWTSVWPKKTQMTSRVTGFLLDAARLQPGQWVLDVGSGTGVATFQAAEIVGPAGVVVGVDISAALVDYAEREAATNGLPAKFTVKDIQQQQVGRPGVTGPPFDAAISQFGVMFFDDPVAAFSNIRAHVVPGGRLAFACWQATDRNPWHVAPALAPFVPVVRAPAPGAAETGPFAFADADYVRSVLTDSGWSEVTRAAHEVEAVVDQGAIVDDEQMRVLGVAEASLAEARAAVDRHLARLRQADGRILAPLAFQIFTAAA